MGFFDFLFKNPKENNPAKQPETHSIYAEKIEKEHINNLHITEQEVIPFKGKPFSLSGKLLFDCGIPYFEPSETDKKIIERDIELLINKAIQTKIFTSYKTGEYIEYAQIRTDIYTPTKKIKKFPISAYINDGITFYVISYTQDGKLGKAEFTYAPNSKQGYTISYKVYSDEIEVRRICSYPIGGGSITELYRRKI